MSAMVFPLMKRIIKFMMGDIALDDPHFGTVVGNV